MMHLDKTSRERTKQKIHLDKSSGDQSRDKQVMHFFKWGLRQRWRNGANSLLGNARVQQLKKGFWATEKILFLQNDVM